MAAFVLGLVQLLGRKGTGLHRALGWAWVVGMALTALTSFWIHTICTFNSFSLIHLLSLYTLISLPVAVRHARQHHVSEHRKVMLSLFFFALVVAGFFTLWPNRIMHDVVFGTATAHASCAG